MLMWCGFHLWACFTLVDMYMCNTHDTRPFSVHTYAHRTYVHSYITIHHACMHDHPSSIMNESTSQPSFSQSQSSQHSTHTHTHPWLHTWFILQGSRKAGQACVHRMHEHRCMHTARACAFDVHAQLSCCAVLCCVVHAWLLLFLCPYVVASQPASQPVTC